jgi:RNA polymerase sigma-70 factor, ECF subfamily
MSAQIQPGFPREQKVLRLVDSNPYPATLPSPEHLHARCARRIARHIGRVLGPDAEQEDLVQEVLMTVFDKIGTLRDPACFDAWVAQVTANKLRQTLRARRLYRQALGVWIERGGGTFEHDLDARQVADRALQVLERLSPSEGALLVAQWFTPGRAQNVVTKTGCSNSTAQRRLRRARTRFEQIARRDPTLAPLFQSKKPLRTDSSDDSATEPSPASGTSTSRKLLSVANG